MDARRRRRGPTFSAQREHHDRGFPCRLLHGRLRSPHSSGDGLPVEYVGHAFSCDPTGNLVHHDRLYPVGATFAARRVREGSEFLRSPDGWFRPVFLAGGPDGALYVADLYRQTIEHPEYLPAEVRKRTDFDAGKGRGRIWRVAAADASAKAKPAARLGSPHPRNWSGNSVRPTDGHETPPSGFCWSAATAGQFPSFGRPRRGCAIPSR
jgi:hypothetical protein